MGFDGVRPTRGADHLNPYVADQAARTDNAKKPQVKKARRDEKADHVHKDLPHYDTEEENKNPPLSDDEIEEILMFAKVRGIMHQAMTKGDEYVFQINPDTGEVDLIHGSSGDVVMSFTPSELMDVMDKIKRYAGVLTDRAG